MELTAETKQPRLAWLEKRKLRKVLRLADLYFFSVCAMLTFETLGQVSVAGAQALTWIVVCGLTFFLPYGAIVAELGAAIPAEGGLYEWVKQAFGPYPAALTAFFYWISNPVWLGGIVTATCIAIVRQFITPLQSTGAQLAFGLVFIWLCVGATVIGLRQGKWLPVSGAWVKVGLVVAFLTLAAGFIGQHGAHAQMSAMAPTWPVLVAVLPALMFSYLGYELQSSAAEEMVAPQAHVPRSVFTSGLTVVVGYVLVIAAILAIVPSARLSSIGGLTDAFGTVSGTHGAWGTLIAVALLFTFLGTATAWLMGGDRTLAVAGMEGTAPSYLGRLSARFGTPVRVNLLSGLVSSLVFAATLGVAGTKLADQFSVALSLTVSVSVMSYLFVFPAFLVLRQRQPHLPRPYRLPGGAAGAWAAVLICEGYAVVTVWFALWPPDASVPTSMVRWSFEAVQGGALALIVVAATLLYWRGRRQLAAHEAVGR